MCLVDTPSAGKSSRYTPLPSSVARGSTPRMVVKGAGGEKLRMKGTHCRRLFLRLLSECPPRRNLHEHPHVHVRTRPCSYPSLSRSPVAPIGLKARVYFSTPPTPLVPCGHRTARTSLCPSVFSRPVPTPDPCESLSTPVIFVLCKPQAVPLCLVRASGPLHLLFVLTRSPSHPSLQSLVILFSNSVFHSSPFYNHSYLLFSSSAAATNTCH
jgi:hypothetical protein